MIFDGLWKKELKKLFLSISIWKTKFLFCEYGKHRLSRALLYSAVILRKVIDAEKEAEQIAKEQNCSIPEKIIKSSTVEAFRYLHTDGNDLVIRGIVFTENYGKSQKVVLKTNDVCNWLVHSYVWDVVENSDSKEYTGFLVASDYDKQKYVHYISFKEWQKILLRAIKHGGF